LDFWVADFPTNPFFHAAESYFSLKLMQKNLLPARLIVTGNCAIYLANITGTGRARQNGISVVTI
jgi:hypothetical protein